MFKYCYMNSEILFQKKCFIIIDIIFPWWRSQTTYVIVEIRRVNKKDFAFEYSKKKLWSWVILWAQFHTCTNSSENASLAAISEFASTILSIEAPPLLTEADSLCFFYLPVGFVKGREIREARLNQEKTW